MTCRVHPLGAGGGGLAVTSAVARIIGRRNLLGRGRGEAGNAGGARTAYQGQEISHAVRAGDLIQSDIDGLASNDGFARAHVLSISEMAGYVQSIQHGGGALGRHRFGHDVLVLQTLRAVDKIRKALDVALRHATAGLASRICRTVWYRAARRSTLRQGRPTGAHDQHSRQQHIRVSHINFPHPDYGSASCSV